MVEIKKICTLNVLRVNDCNYRKSLEIAGIEGNQKSNSMCEH